jgi:hypothetical protein
MYKYICKKLEIVKFKNLQKQCSLFKHLFIVYIRVIVVFHNIVCNLKLAPLYVVSISISLQDSKIEFMIFRSNNIDYIVSVVQGKVITNFH